jgi:hypothetical protein
MRQKDGTVKIMDSRVYPDGAKSSLSQCVEEWIGEGQGKLALARPIGRTREQFHRSHPNRIRRRMSP